MAETAPQPWLPANAIETAAHRLPMRAAIDDWAAKWFAHGGATLSGMEMAGADFRPAGAGLELDEGLIVTVSDRARDAIAVLMFGDPHCVATPADRAAIAAAVDQSIADLRGRVGQLFGLPPEAAWQSRRDDPLPAGYSFRIRLGNASQPLVITVAHMLLARMIVARLRPEPARPPLDAIADGLAPHPVTLSASLGASRLAVGELAALRQGDVVVLDSLLTDPAMLVVDRAATPAPCRIVAGGNHLDLVLA